MKKIFALMFTTLFSAFALFASAEMNFTLENNTIVISNSDSKSKTICKDNVRFLNSTYSTINFDVYGRIDKDSSNQFLCSLTVKSKDTQLESCKTPLSLYKYIYVVCKNGKANFSKITCEHNDMYFYISDFEENETSNDMKLPGFWGINWGTSRTEAKGIVSAKGNYIISEETTDGVAFKGKFAGSDATIVLYFFDNKFYRGCVDYAYEENRAVSKYKSVKNQIETKYGSPTEIKEVFLKPYYMGDGYEETAIKVNKGIYMSSWNFSDNNKITLFISKSLSTLLFYENSELSEISSKKEKQQNMEDF